MDDITKAVGSLSLDKAAVPAQAEVAGKQQHQTKALYTLFKRMKMTTSKLDRVSIVRSDAQICKQEIHGH